MRSEASAWDGGEAHWRERLSGELPRSAPLPDLSRLPSQRRELAIEPIALSVRESELIARWGEGSPIPLYGSLVACVAIVLAKHSQSDDVLVWGPPRADDETMIPIRIPVRDTGSLRDFLAFVRRRVEEDYRHQSSFPPRVGDSLAALMDGDGYQNLLVSADPLHRGKWLEPGRDIAFRFGLVEDKLVASVEYDASVYLAASIRPIARQVGFVLAQAAFAPELPLAKVALMNAAETRRVLREFNAESCPYPRNRTLGELIAQQCKKVPAAVCAVHQGETLSFSELEADSNRLARLLQQVGVRSGSFVAILEPRGLSFLKAMVAIWKAGGAYVPIDPTYPDDRVAYMLGNCEASVVITSLDAATRFSAAMARSPQLRTVVCQDALGGRLATPFGCEMFGQDRIATYSPEPLSACSGPSDPAYMIYTSGSTGQPKGAIVRHDGAINHIFAQAHALGRENVARFLQSAPSSSDISVWQFAAPLVFGGTTVIIDDPSDVEQLVTLIRAHAVAIIELVPVVAKYLMEYLQSRQPEERELPTLEWMMITGESAPVDLVNAWLAMFPAVPVVNAYGPTEAADDVVQALIRSPLPGNQLRVPIGRPLANLDVYVLDDSMRPCPAGIPGEICVAGVGVGNGYWRLEEKTQLAFVANPFPEARGSVIYKTGDAGRWRDDGVLEFLGRRDQQVQVRGFRIELAELETALRAHPDVKEAVAAAFYDGGGGGYLAAYVVTRSGAPLDSGEARRFMGKRLPGYMVPTGVISLDSIPLTPAGKVDRKRLPQAISIERRQTQSRQAPRTRNEGIIAEIFARVFDLPSVSIDDDFFELGGDSLTALEIVVGARVAGLRLKPGDVLSSPTVAQLAQLTRALPDSEASSPAEDRLLPIQPLDVGAKARVLAANPRFEDIYPLSPTQEGIYSQTLLSPDKSAYVDQYCFQLTGDLDVSAFREAWREVVSEHPILRTAFVRRLAQRPLQVVLREVAVPFEFFDASQRTADERAAVVDAYRAEQIARGLKLGEAPLMRLGLIWLGEGRHLLVWTHHHLLLDGWSMNLVLERVVARYCGKPDAKSGRDASMYLYRSFIDWLERQDLRRAERYWCDTLSGCKPAVPLLLEPPQDRSLGYAEAEVQLSQAETSTLQNFARNHGLTLNTVAQGAWGLLVARYSRSSDVTFGIVASGRQIALENVSAIVGVFVATLPLRVTVDPEPGLIDWLRGIQDQALLARDYEHVPLARIQEWSGLSPNERLFETLFVMSNFPQKIEVGASELSVEYAQFRTVPAYPLTAIIVPGSRLLVRLTFDSSRYSRPGISRLLETYRSTLSAMAAGARSRIRDVEKSLQVNCSQG